MKHNLKLKEDAIALRKKGFSFGEISEILHISKSTASLWLRDIELSVKARERIKKLGIAGRERGIITRRGIAEREDKLIRRNSEEILEELKNIENSISFSKLICAILYWCEGGKLDGGRMSFINSDPSMISYFLKMFRKSFTISESKFRISIHLHSYHNPKKQIEFWSKVTDIPSKQFIKPFLKKNSGKIKRENYPGCISVRYYDYRIRKELIDLYKTLSK